MAETTTLVGDRYADRLMSVAEVAERLRVGRAIVSELINYHVLPAIRVKNQRRIRVFCFNDFLCRLEGHDLYEILAEAKESNATKQNF